MEPSDVNAYRVSGLCVPTSLSDRQIWYTLEGGLTSGEMAEWLKAHAWKACLPQGNPTSIESIVYRRNSQARIIRREPFNYKQFIAFLGVLCCILMFQAVVN